MQPTNLQDTTTQLTYSLMTKPLPVEVSLSPTAPSLATLIFVVSCPVPPGSVSISKITISIPYDQTGQDPDPTNLAMTQPQLSDVSITSSDSAQWTKSQTGDTFTFTPPGGKVDVSMQSLTIEFTKIQVSTLVGTALVTINEYVTGITTANTQSVAVAKFPYGFYAGNFTSNKPMVNNGEKPVLSWMGSANATYLMLYESNAPIDVSNVRTWSPPNGLTQMTTFILRVSAQQEGQTATMDFSIAIEVANPSLTSQDLTVLTTSTLKGAVNVGASGTPADLVVNGNVQSQGTMTTAGKLTAQADAAVSGNLNVVSDTTLQRNLNVSSLTTAKDLTVTGNASMQGALTAFTTSILGPVSLLAISQKQAGTYTAPTDGLVIGTIWPPTTAFGPFYLNGTIQGSSGGINVYATGGGWVECIGSPNGFNAQMSGTFILPVKKGNSWTVKLLPGNAIGLNPPPPLYAFYFVALGTGAVSATATKKRTASKKLTAKKQPAAKKRPTARKKPSAKKTRKR